MQKSIYHAINGFTLKVKRERAQSGAYRVWRGLKPLPSLYNKYEATASSRLTAKLALSNGGKFHLQQPLKFSSLHNVSCLFSLYKKVPDPCLTLENQRYLLSCFLYLCEAKLAVS